MKGEKMKNENKLTGLLKELDYVRDQVQCLGDQVEEMHSMNDKVEKLTRDFWEYAESTNIFLKKNFKNKCCQKK
jgi:hypothetical protein